MFLAITDLLLNTEVFKILLSFDGIKYRHL